MFVLIKKLETVFYTKHKTSIMICFMEEWYKNKKCEDVNKEKWNIVDMFFAGLAIICIYTE